MMRPSRRYEWTAKMTYGELHELVVNTAIRVSEEYDAELTRLEALSKNEQRDRFFRNWRYQARNLVSTLNAWGDFLARYDPQLYVSLSFDDFEFFVCSHCPPCNYMDESEGEEF